MCSLASDLGYPRKLKITGDLGKLAELVFRASSYETFEIFKIEGLNATKLWQE